MTRSSQDPRPAPAPRGVRAGLLLGLFGALSLSVGACKRELPASVQKLERSGEAHWTRSARFVEMLPAVAHPSNRADREQVSIYLHLPEGSRVSLDEQDRPQLPPGAEIDRLEWLGTGDQRSLTDVRGTRFDQDGRALHHNLRRTEISASTALLGFEWPAADAEAHEAATAILIKTMRGYPPAAKMNPDAQQKFLDGLAKKNECGRCHQSGRPDATRRGEQGVVDRGTDASGMFSVLDVLRNDRALESYGAFDPNRDRAAVAVRCPEGEPKWHKEGEKRRRYCAEKAVPMARYDAKKAAQLEPARHAKVCRSRRYLLEHMSPEDQARFPGALEACPPG